jgi:hypothetical protein
MSRHHKPPKSANSRKSVRAGDVGYGRPPRARQYKPGQSGNPKGRPKGKQNTDTVIREILDRKVEVRVGGALRKITVRQAILTRFAEDALKGNPKSAAFLFNRYDALNSEETPNEVVNQDDQAIIDAFAQRLLQTERKEKS